jgi:hypothetical protein
MKFFLNISIETEKMRTVKARLDRAAICRAFSPLPVRILISQEKNKSNNFQRNNQHTTFKLSIVIVLVITH